MIEITGLCKTFNAGTINETRALQNITLHVNRGDFVTIIGTNGSGKSTLLNAIAGSFLPDAGEIRIDGRVVTRLRDYQRAVDIARVFQNPFSGTAPQMTILENLHMAWLRNKHIRPLHGLDAARREACRSELRQLEMQMEDRLDHVIGSLSGGQRQAITLLMAAIARPKVLLLDEHTAALDPKSAAQVIKLTSHFIEREQLTAIMVTHSMQQALDLGNRTIMMHKGQIIDDIPLEDKRRITSNDLLDKFAELRKSEQLTDDLLMELRQEYI
ncbi:MAG TPA: ATP-binding cassette domain-containing protein [bacterium]|nr:ATP-binding cassette domain-containing protein [bacterium]HPR87966.1 ATP-binding cassette domain-containing protein [bacterium]